MAVIDFTDAELRQIIRAERYLSSHRGFGQHPAFQYAEHVSVVDKVTRELTAMGIDVSQL